MRRVLCVICIHLSTRGGEPPAGFTSTSFAGGRGGADHDLRLNMARRVSWPAHLWKRARAIWTPQKTHTKLTMNSWIPATNSTGARGGPGAGGGGGGAPPGGAGAGAAEEPR